MTSGRNARVFSKVPHGKIIYDTCRSLKQARSMISSYPSDSHAVIVRNGANRGKDKVSFPYEIAVDKNWS